jgi:hypothetical protein
MTPAVAVLVMRRIDMRWGRRGNGSDWRFTLPLVPAAALAMAVAWADVSLADTARTAARTIGNAYAKRGGELWFEGHWGFQYYMEQNGGTIIKFDQHPRRGNNVFEWMVPRPTTNDLLIEPSNDTDVLTKAFINTRFQVPPRLMKTSDRNTFTFMPLPWLTTNLPQLRAGFYSHTYGGQLPFAFGHVLPEVYHVYRFTGP